MSITVTLTPATRSGTCNLPLAALATESVTFTGADLADGVIVTVMQPDGTPVASGSVASGAVELDLNTKEAHRATVTLPVGVTTKAFLVIGDTDALRFVVPALLQRNYLDDVIPPTATVPVYPTLAELNAILEAVQTAQEETQEILDKAEKIDETIGTVVDEFGAAVTAAETLINKTVADGVTEIGGAVNTGVAELNAAKENAIDEVAATKNAIIDEVVDVKNAALAEIDTAEASAVNLIDAKAQEGVADIAHATETSVGLINQAKTNAVDEIGAVKTQAEGELTALVGQAQTAKGDAETARDEALVARAGAENAQALAETAQHGAEEAAEAAETALNNGCIYQVREVADSAITLDKTLTAYKHTPTADTAYTFTAPAEAQGKIIVFWLWVIMGATAHQLTFPAGVTWISEGSFAANTETLLAFMSTDGGASWQANVQWEVTA